jgi:hypothetical protein
MELLAIRVFPNSGTTGVTGYEACFAIAATMEKRLVRERMIVDPVTVVPDHDFCG